MSHTDPPLWPPGDDPSEGADSIAGQLASRIDAPAPAPGDAMDWASVAAGYEREAVALGAHPAAAELLFEAGRLYEERLSNAPAALDFHRRAYALAPGFLPNLRALRRLAMDAGDDALAAEALEAEAAATPLDGARADLLLLRGRLLAALGRDAEARETRERAASLAPAGFAACEEAARLAAERGDRAALADAYVRCARSADAPALAAHYLSAASALHEEALGNPDRAGALALEAHALLPADPLLRSAARRHAERLGRPEDAAALLREEAAALDAGEAVPVLQELARVEERLGHGDAALEALERAWTEAPDHPLVLAELARLREARGEWAQASEALEGLAAAHRARGGPGHVLEVVAARLRRAEIEEESLGRTAEAIRCCREVVALEPANRSALSMLGRLCARAGDWEGLLAAFRAEAAAARDPRDRAHRLFKAAEVTEERLGRFAEAAALYRTALEGDPDLLGARAALERLHAQLGQWEALAALLEADLERMAAPAERAAHLHRIARLREERIGDTAGAAALYRRVLELEPKNRVALTALGEALERLLRYAELADVLAREAALASDPRRRSAIQQRRAELLEEHGDDPERARAAWEEVRALAPEHLPALRALGRHHARAGRWEEVVAMFRAEADAASDPAVAADLVLRIGGLLERRLGRVDDALEAYREVLTLAPAHLAAMHALARLYRARGDHERLVELLRAHAAARPDSVEKAAALSEAGHIAEERLGDAARAIEDHEEALRSAPAFEPARRALERLYAATGRTALLAALRRAAAQTVGAARPERLLALARLEADRVRDPDAALSAAEELRRAAPDHPAALLLELRLAREPARRAAARAALAEGAGVGESAGALLAAAALETAAVDGRRARLARAATLAPAGAALAPEAERRLRAEGEPGPLARFCEARRGEAADAPSRASWSVRAGEAWERAGDPDRALAAFQSALSDAPAHLPALRSARALLARRGDWGAVRATLQAEAAALQDPHEAARAWREAAAIAEQRFDDVDAAVVDYRRAAERDPDDAAALARLETLLAGQGATEVATLHETRARVERDPDRAAEAWLDAARAVLPTEGGREAALEALDRALDARADLSAALELRARLRAEAGRPADALADLDALLALGGEAGALVPAHLAAAALLHDRLGDGARAAAHLEAALGLAPDQAEALGRLARLHRDAGRPGAAASVLHRLAGLPGFDAESQVGHLVALAEAQAEIPDAAAALATCRRLLALAPGNPAALRLVLRLEERRGDAEGLAAALAGAAAEAQDATFQADAHLRAAELHAGPLRSRARAIEHLRAAVAADPDRADARALLADQCEDSAPALAAEQHRWLLARDPLRATSWTALFRTAERSRAHDRAYVAASVLRWLGAPAPGPAAERLLLEGDRQALPPPPPLADDDWQVLRAAGDAGPLADVVAAAADALALAADLPAPGRGAPLREDHPFRRLLAELARCLGAGEWELHGAPLGQLGVEPGAPPSVRVGADLAHRTTAREQRFLLGRVAARLRARSELAQAVDPARLGDLVAAAVRQVVPGYAGTGRPPEALVRAVGKSLSRRARRALEEPAGALAALRPAPDLAAWRAAAAASADRAGLVLCGDISTALALLGRELPARAADGPVALEAVRARPDALALLSFAATDAHFALRQRLRVAIA